MSMDTGTVSAIGTLLLVVIGIINLSKSRK